ncbi:MAG: signal recognition particle-docking protein FtsY [Kiritimatiellae bacterium]|nr:signal recognition particle-docking protein FtsY [Kiritimatiellia bacterium]MCO5067608.1 signal recognition particle-docking protein FtsY [Kiritimatiellia bacterium]
MVSWINALSRTRQKVAGALASVFNRGEKGERLDAEALEELEATLLLADLPAALAAELTAEMEKAYKGLRVDGRDMLRQLLVRALGDVQPYSWPSADPLLSVLVVGINGSGKTTTCAKLAGLAKRAGRRPLLGAADTFRAAGSEQLRIWSERIGCEAVVGQTGADAAAVAFDALTAARARSCDVAVIDTAGRMHTKQPLMEELGKVRRSMAKCIAGAPNEIWLVLDAALGQNAIVQARMFNEAAPLTGVIVAKLDGSAKAGFIFSIARELKLPIRYVGLGEGMEDLAPFEPLAFVNALLGYESPYKEINSNAAAQSG